MRSVVALGMAILLSACAKPPPPVAQSSAPAAPAAPAETPTQTECAEGSEWDGKRCVEVAASIVEPPGRSEPAPDEPPAEPAIPDEPEAAVGAPIQPVQPPTPPTPVKTKPVTPTSREPRKMASAPRAQALVITEIQALERLLAVTTKTSPDHVLLVRRLAETYVELEYSAAAGKDAKSAKVLAAARKKAIQYYLLLKNDYPTNAKLDEVLYYLGYEYERAGDKANARATYRELVKEFPKSSFVLRVPKAWKKP